MVAGADAQLIERECPQAGLTIIDAFCFVKLDEDIVIDAPRIGVLRCPESPHPFNPPGSGANEALAGHNCESGQQTGRRDVRQRAQLLRITSPCVFNRAGHRVLLCAE